MVATDIAARGLDIDSITLVTDEDRDMIRSLERIMSQPLKRETLPDFDYSTPEPPRHGHALHDARQQGRRPARPVPTPMSYTKNRLAPRRR